MAKKIMQRPTGVTILAVLAWIGAVFGVLGGIMMFLGSGFLPGYRLGAFGIVYIILGVVAFFVGKGLWDGKNWARITGIILSVLGLLSGLGTLFVAPLMGIVNIIINGVIIWYLGFNEEAKSYLSK